jgi:gliding motility-associated-like protein
MRYILTILFVFISFFLKAQQEVVLCPENRTTFTYWSNPSVSGGGWIWVLNNDTISNYPNVRITWRDTGFYVIKVIYKKDCGEPSQLYNVKVLTCPKSAIFFPNAFTPNGDGLNDGWSPIPIRIIEMKWQVFNRYGEKVYESKSLQDKWNGTYKNVAQPMSNFVYQCWWRSVDGKTGYKKGNLILIR